MSCIDNIDMNQPLVLMAAMREEAARNGTVSPYFEELWNQLVACLDDLETRVYALENP